MLQSVVALQPSLVSPSNTWAERLRWRAAALACRDANIARNLPYEKSCRTAGCQAVFWRYAADISQHEANVARAGSKDQS